MNKARPRAIKGVKPPKPKVVSLVKKLVAKADSLARDFCRAKARCEAKGWHDINCSQRFEWCHIKSRGIRIIRHDPKNSVCMCNTHHRYFTQHPDEWVKFINETFPGRWNFLNKRIQDGDKPNYQFWIDFYERHGS